mgnify:CR=1 FL=1
MGLPPIEIRSEIGPLKRVLLHRPGRELENLMPEYIERLLFDDIPYLKIAQEEHDAFCHLLRQNGVEVVYLTDLVAESLADPAVKDQFLREYITEAGIWGEKRVGMMLDYFKTMSTKNMVEKMMEGVRKSEVRGYGKKNLTDYLDDYYPFVLDPIPNLYFTRDPFAVVGGGVTIHRMHTKTRNRETLFGKYIFEHHPRYKQVPKWYDRAETASLEGGDILVLSPEVLAVGISERTEAAAIDTLAHNLFWGEEPSAIDTVYAIRIPFGYETMHLDTVFTQIDYDKFTIHPGIMGPLTVFEITPDGNGGTKIRERNEDLEKVLSEYVGEKVTLIPCGGGDRIAAEREQWNDGSNTLCIRPGTVVVYQRNNVTNDVLYKQGINCLEMPSAELSRGRGGPRCMSCPVNRDDL